MDTTEELLLTITQVAQICGKSRRTVEHWIRNDDLQVAEAGGGRGKTTKIDARELWKWGQKRSASQELNFQRARLAEAQADKTELELALKKGSMLSKDEVEIRWTRMVTNARAKFLSLIQRLPPALRSTDFSHRAMSAVIKQLIYEVLTELSTYDGQRPPGEPSNLDNKGSTPRG